MELTPAVTWNSMNLLGTSSAPISMTRAVPIWNSMELWVRQFRWHQQFHGIPCKFGVRQFRWHEQFHGIPWNLEGTNFDDMSSSMEFHGTSSAPILLIRAVPWNSMEHGVRQFRWHEQFHGIPWNLGCANFADTSSSMEFHGTWSAPITMTRAVPWNSMELGGHQFRWHEQFYGIPWYSMELEMRQFRWHEQFHGITWNYMQLGVRQFRLHEQLQGIPGNSRELGVRQFRRHQQFHGIPWV